MTRIDKGEIRVRTRQGLAGFCFFFCGVRSQTRRAAQDMNYYQLMGVLYSGLRRRKGRFALQLFYLNANFMNVTIRTLGLWDFKGWV